MVRRTLLDTELVRRGLARSREQAADLMTAGRVAVSGQTAAKAATQVGQDAAITIAEAGSAPDYVSRGGHKLEGALTAFTGLTVAGRRCLDAGASTGGFTDVLLRAGAAHVVAVDVGYGQLAWALRTDPRVTVLDRVNVRQLTPEQVAPAPSLVTADLSFISLSLVLPALVACAAPDADFVLLVKPQFEVGKGNVGAGGVVRDPAVRAEAIRAVQAVRGFPLLWGWFVVMATNPLARTLLREAVWRVAIAFGCGLVVEAGVRLLLARPVQILEGRSPGTGPNPSEDESETGEARAEQGETELPRHRRIATPRDRRGADRRHRDLAGRGYGRGRHVGG